MPIKPIRTESDYKATLAEIESLMDAQPGSPEEDILDVLATLVKVYEDEHYPISQSGFRNSESPPPSFD